MHVLALKVRSPALVVECKVVQDPGLPSIVAACPGVSLRHLVLLQLKKPGRELAPPQDGVPDGAVVQTRGAGPLRDAFLIPNTNESRIASCELLDAGIEGLITASSPLLRRCGRGAAGSGCSRTVALLLRALLVCLLSLALHLQPPRVQLQRKLQPAPLVVCRDPRPHVIHVSGRGVLHGPRQLRHPP